MKNEFCLIFDMDGTLWDATENIKNSGNEVIEREKGWKDYLTLENAISVMGLEIEEIADTYFPNLDKKEALELTNKVLSNENIYLSKHGGNLYDKLEETLAYLKSKYDLFIVTNAQDGYVEAFYEAHPTLSQYFKDYETYGKTMKPKGHNIKLIMERNDYTKAYYVGDTQKDYDACKYAGVNFVYASYGFGSVDSYDKKIETFEDLKEIF